MFNVLVRCPVTGETVPTMLRMKAKDLEAMSGARAFRCPKCDQIHQWTKDEAWLAPSLRSDYAG